MSKIRSSAGQFVLQPFDMETKDDYLVRFSKNRDMKAVFGESYMCREIAQDIWAQRWAEACVTVRLLNGDEYFVSC